MSKIIITFAPEINTHPIRRCETTITTHGVRERLKIKCQ